MQNEYFVCLPKWGTGYDGTPDGGAGWEEGKIMKNKSTNPYRESGAWIIWPEAGGNGIYYRAVRHANEEEIAAYEAGVRNIKNIIPNYEIY